MLKLKGVLKNYIWGGKKLEQMYNKNLNGENIAESWEVSVHHDGVSTSNTTTLSEYISHNPSVIGGDLTTLPILIKFIDAKQNLSVQVHPDDAYANRVENDNGKTEMWYIIDADENAGIYCGFKKDTNAQEFLQKTADGTVYELLNYIPVKKGDCFLIKAGTVHAIGSGCLICEVQQSSNVTYRVYDYDRVGADGKKKQLHIDKAVEVINFNKFVDETFSGEYVLVNNNKIRLLTKCKYFASRELLLNGCFTEKNEKSFTALNFLSGSGTINGTSFNKGDSFFVDKNEKITIEGNAKVILTTLNV